jgi:DNA-binding GntR family transcriptional regulator
MSEAVGKPQFQVNRLERSTLLDHVYRQLTELILDGEIAPGQSITINSLADAFGVSAMPVREALQRLTAERVLTVISGRTIGVPPLSAERFYDLLRVRLEVEALASEWASEFITADDLAQLESCINEMDTTIQSGNMPSYIRLNRAFHFQIYRASHSQALMSIIETLWLQISPYFHFLHDSGNYSHARKHHKEILGALIARDKKSIRKGIQSDLQSAGDVIAVLLKKANP